VLALVGEALAQLGCLVALVGDRLPLRGHAVAVDRDEVTSIRIPVAVIGVGDQGGGGAGRCAFLGNHTATNLGAGSGGALTGTQQLRFGALQACLSPVHRRVGRGCFGGNPDIV
jgi:hypothetical protein